VPDVEFERIVNMHYGSLYRFAFSLARNEAEAWDLTQQTFYLWATKGHQLRDAEKLKSWLLTTLHREFLGTKRHEARFPHFEVTAMAHELPNVTPAMINAMDGQAVMDCLVQVEDPYRAPLVLFYLEDMSYKEIAELLGVATGTVMSRLSRGKAQLRQLLAVDRAGRTERAVSVESISSKADHG
jgi:RNA polymerase sigma-70 factor (ECF subfamily)